MTQDNSNKTEQDTVLVVEDEGLAELYALWLSDQYEVRTAYDGLEALEQFDDDVDVVLLDRNLPKQSGEKVLKKIHELDSDCKVTVISDVEPDVDVASMPVDDYFMKPVARERLEAGVEELLLRSRTDAAKQELLALISRRIAIEEGPLTNLTESTEYEQLHEQIATLEKRLTVDPSDISSIYRPDVCPECNLRWDMEVDGVVGFINIASRVWKCRECGNSVRRPDPNSRRVARR